MKQMLFTILFAACVGVPALAQNGLLPADAHATAETVNLYRNMKRMAATGYFFGHQDALAYGAHWKYNKDSCDVKNVTGDYPAVYGWDMAGIESGQEKDLDGVPFKEQRKYIKQVYERGGINTFSWHMPSPLGGGKNAWDTTHNTVATILPGGENHELYKSWLDKAAAYITTLKGSKGEPIPLLFRPFHELTGNWFWWCRNTCSDIEFVTLWRFTIYYLREVKNLHNLLIVYNTSGGFENEANFLARYPGDDMADALSFDTYQYDDPNKNDYFEKNCERDLAVIEKIANEKGKLFALAETGYEQIPYASWWTDRLLKAIGDHKISYVLLWRNAGWNQWLNPPRMHYYVPYAGDVSAEDFKQFYKLPQTLFQQEATAAKLYQPPVL